MLELLGDIGGLYGALEIIAATIASPLASFRLKAKLLTSLFREVELQKESKVRLSKSAIAGDSSRSPNS